MLSTYGAHTDRLKVNEVVRSCCFYLFRVRKAERVFSLMTQIFTTALRHSSSLKYFHILCIFKLAGCTSGINVPSLCSFIFFPSFPSLIKSFWIDGINKTSFTFSHVFTNYLIFDFSQSFACLGKQFLVTQSLARRFLFDSRSPHLAITLLKISTFSSEICSFNCKSKHSYLRAVDSEGMCDYSSLQHTVLG